MQRVLKDSSQASANSKRVTQSKFTSNSSRDDIASQLNSSPNMIAQRKKLHSLFGGAAQLKEGEEELGGPLQKKADEDLEGATPQLKADTTQRLEDETQLKSEPSVQRLDKDEEIKQPKFASEATAQLEQQAKPNNTGLPDNLKSGIENLSGMAMDNVKVHYNSSQPAQLNALAYAQGSDIHVAPGQEQHLPHEAWHVVQQAQGRVQPTMQMKDGVPVNDDKGLEREADVMGSKANLQQISAPIEAARSAQHKAGSVSQFYQVADDHVRGDLRHPKGDTLFEPATIVDITTRAGGAIGAVSNVVLDGAVNASRAAGQMDYSVLSREKVSSEKQLTAFLGKSQGDEHMYVLDAGEVHVAIRAEDKKLPHPTLVGGDPDVTCAGTIRTGGSNEVVVTASSGHFRPTSAAPGQKAVEKIMEKTARKGFKRNVTSSKH